MTGPVSAELAPRRHHRGRTVATTLVCAGLLIVLGPAGLALFLQHRLSGHIQRIDGAFTGLKHRPSRPAGQASKAVNILVVSVDRSRSAVTGGDFHPPRWLPGARHVDSLMVLHLDGDRRGASVIAIPLESLVEVSGHGTVQIDSAVSTNNPSLLVATAEKLTNLRIDHLAAFDWAGFARLTDADDGVRLASPTTRNGSSGAAGKRTFTGAEALSYVAEGRGTA